MNFNNKVYNVDNTEEKIYNQNEKHLIRYKKEILNSAFTEMTIKNEPFNKKYNMVKLYNLYTYDDKSITKEEILRSLIFLNNL